MGTLSNNSKVGDKGKDLILQTSGRVYVQVKDRFYEINFRGDDEKDKEEEKEETPRVIFVDDASVLDDSYPYPGDDYLIIAGGEFFQTTNGEYKQISISAQVNTTFTTPLTITTLESPFNISSTNLVRNLNAEYLNGVSSTSFTRKDNNENITEWTINTLNSNIIKDVNSQTILNLKGGTLDIDTIRVKNLFVDTTIDENNSSTTISNDFDIINKKTYITDGLKINKITLVDKLKSFITVDNSTATKDATKTVEYYSNENYLVGGYSIVDLIISAFNNELITEFDEVHEYINRLTICKKLNDNLVWEVYTTTKEDFEKTDSGSYLYQNYKFTPVDSAIFSNYLYGTSSTCLEGIYNKWYNIENYIGDIKNTYQGISYEFEVIDNTIDAGDLLIGKTSSGILKFLAVGSTPSTIRVIAEGTDCYFNNNTLIEEYQTWENNPPIEEPELTNYQNIKTCLENSNIVSPKINDILLTGSNQNIIGNISGTENSIFGTLEGYGLTSEGNCYFVNPGIALVNEENKNYLKLTNKDTSFIGLNDKSENWISINADGTASISTSSYTLQSDGTLNIGNWLNVQVLSVGPNNMIVCDLKRDDMYNINNYNSFCNFGPLVIQEDGSATIGKGETQINIDINGTVRIPKAAILDI